MRLSPAGRVVALALFGAGLQLSCADATSPGSDDPVPAAIVALVTVSPVAAGDLVATPPSVRVVTSSGAPVPDVAVTFEVTAGDGVLEGASRTTDAEGVATVASWRLGTAVDTNTVVAHAGTLAPATFTVLSVSGPPASLTAASVVDQEEGEGLAVPEAPAVRVLDQHGNPVRNVVVAFTVVEGDGALAGPNPQTDELGVARVSAWTLGGAGTQRVKASVAQLAGDSVVFVAQAIALPVATIEVQVSDTSPVVGDSLVASVTLRDSLGRALPRRPVEWGSDDSLIARIAANGRGLALLPGVATLSASREGKTGHAVVDVSAPVLEQSGSGITGHLSTSINASVPEPPYQYGFSNYVTIGTLQETPTAGTQLGWGSWAKPDNRAFAEPVCPIGTYARDNWPERGPTWADVYQNIEGGVGQWVSGAFQHSTPKFRVNATPDCYDNQVASSAWSFYGPLLPDAKITLAQLSNRMLLPPAGINFEPTAGPAVFGTGWIPLPLIDAYTSPAGVATGDQSWTLFLHTSNFRGPVAFYTPETWSALNATDHTGVGRGHDANASWFDALAMEIGSTPAFFSEDSSGTRYARIPRITFPTSTPSIVLSRQVRFYSKDAIWNAFDDWVEDGTAATAFDAGGAFAPGYDWSNTGVSMDGSTVLLADALHSSALVDASGPAFGLVWENDFEPGVIPEYYVETPTGWQPIKVEDVPRETWLVDQTFAPATDNFFPAVNTVANSPWAPAKWAAGPFSVALGDGSIVEYVWYRFVDQPAIARLGLGQEELDRLQAFAESFHAASGLDGVSFDSPLNGTLIAIDPAHFVTPPAGLDVGYVPLVISQH